VRSVALIACLSLGAIARGASRPGVVYAEPADDADGQALDLYLPNGADPTPVLLFFHGGVWRLGDKEQYAGLGRAFAGRGFLTAVVNYRLVPGATHDEQLDDAARAVAWAFAHAPEFGGDPKRIFLAGHLAGGELIASLVFRPDLLRRRGVEPSALAGVIPLSGIFDLGAPIDDTEDGGREDYIRPVFGGDAAALRHASPLFRVGPTPVPWLVLVAGDDSRAMRAQSVEFSKALKTRGLEAELNVAEGRGHFELVEHMSSAGDAAAERVARFIRKHSARPTDQTKLP
jgi:acetyl esterase/lipase